MFENRFQPCRKKYISGNDAYMQPIYIEYWGHEDEEVFAPMPDPKPIPSIDISWPVDNLGPYIDDLVFAQRDHHAVSDDVTILPQFVSYFKDISSNGINRIFEYLLRECVYLILSHSDTLSCQKRQETGKRFDVFVTVPDHKE